MEMSGRTQVQADLEQPEANQFGAIGVKKVKKVKKMKKKPEMPISTPELDEFDIGKNLPNIGANTIDHPGNDLNQPQALPAQPADNSSVPQLDFDPNVSDNSAMGVNANAPLGNLMM